jgi:hypothetical protein
MANSIRTPRQGTTANSRRIAQAVDNEEWQQVRLSMKGISTFDKIQVLEEYWMRHGSTQQVMGNIEPDFNDDVVIRIDNYIKALCRGGQLQSGCTIHMLVDQEIVQYIRK